MSQYPDAIEMYVPRDRVFINQNTHEWIVIHKTAGGSSAQAIADYFATTPLMTSSHFVVGRDGTIVQCVRLEDGAAANCCLTEGHADFLAEGGNYNLRTISIECVDETYRNTQDMTPAQKNALFKLVKWLCEKYDIPERYGDEAGGIIGHCDLDPVNRADCPGPRFPWDELWRFLKEGDQMGVPTGWKDNGKELVAPNGIKVVRGFRDYILSHPWDSGNYPLEPEQAMSPVELSNPSLGNGTGQRFRWASLKWTASKGVYLSWVGQEEKYLRERVVALEKNQTTPNAHSQAQQAISLLQQAISLLQRI